MERGVLMGVAALRWVAWGWLAAVAAANLHRVDHPALAVLAIVVTLGMTTAAQFVAPRPPVVVTELAVAVAVVVADGWVRQGRITGQSLAGTWPLAVILTVAVVAGPVWGALSGLLLGAARGLATAVAGVDHGQLGRAAVAAFSTALFWVAVAAVFGTVVSVLRRTQSELAEATVRERIARDLHDGVLQTLTLIERRAPSTEVARLAREQEQELRAYLFGDHRQPGGLAAELRAAATKVERAWTTITVTVTVGDDLPVAGAAAVAQVVTEALTNAAKHGHAAHAVVFADLDDNGSLFVSVKDDGSGFDPESTGEGNGLRHSIRGRIEELGGSVAVASREGDGAEVRITVPIGAVRA